MPPMIFVLGYGRSGTTMMGHILGNHPDVYLFQELNFFEKIWNRRHDGNLTEIEASELAAKLVNINRYGYAALRDHAEFIDRGKEIVRGMTEKAITQVGVYEAFLRYTVAKNRKSIPCEQTPGYVFCLRDILELFPDAKIINMIRDPKDVLLSRKNKWRQFGLRTEFISLQRTMRTWVHYHPISISYLWKSAVKTAQVFVDAGHAYQVRFEDVLMNPEREIPKICDFIGISYQESMLKVPIIGSSFIKENPEKKKIDKSRISNWHKGGLNSAELFINQKITGDIMARYGYEATKVFPNPILLGVYLITLPLRMLLTYFLHKKQFQSMSGAIRKRLLR